MKNLYIRVLGEKSCLYYLAWFEQFDRQKSGLKFSWNWAAFFASGIWALYRKQYVWFFIFSVLLAAIILIGKFTANIAAILFLLVSTLFGLFANVIYHNSVKQKIITAQFEIPDETRRFEFLRTKGGIHSWVIWIFFWLPLSGGVIALGAAGKFQQYKVTLSVNASPSTAKKANLVTVEISQHSIFDVFSKLVQLDSTNKLKSTESTAESDLQLQQDLMQEVNDFNSHGSEMLNKKLRKDKMKFEPGLRMLNYYSFPSFAAHQIKPLWIKKRLQPQLKQAWCANAARHNAATATYVYSGNDGVEIARFEVKKGECTSTLTLQNTPSVARKALANPSKPIAISAKPVVVQPMLSMEQSQLIAAHEPVIIVPEQHCEIKPVMTDEDYAACGLTPPSSLSDSDL